MNLGDRIAANPIVHAIGRAIGCVDPETKQLRTESTCHKVMEDLNRGRYADAFYDRFWPQPKEKEK